MVISQTNLSLSDPKNLPTMYELKSEDPEEPGLPDEFHDFQPELLRLTFRPPHYPADQIFTGSDLNLYYDVNHTQWYKRPDWFAVLGVSRLYENKDLRLSYVIWHERVTPLVVVELLSPGTEQEDLGQTRRKENEPPTKWEVYEKILKIPYYFVFNRYQNELQVFRLREKAYEKLKVEGQGVWLEEAQLGLGLWAGKYETREGLWLRWYDRQGNWILTPEELERQRVLELEEILARYQERFGDLS